LTGLVNNAGIGLKVPFLELEDAAWKSVLEVNLTGAFIVGQEVARSMAEHGGGSIINMSSVAADIAHQGLSAYSVTKAGLLALTRSMAFELAPERIRVNALAPGVIDTPMLAETISKEAQAARLARIPMGQFGATADVAAAAAYLLADDSAYMTGQSLVIDGGLRIAGIPD
jgi:NAD(P)-dependent dehydrogenase (short-subunit alcohol dehydrogenase family)